jgi:hypothetical protein
MNEKILERLNRLEPISLEEMSSIRLMNRIDSKFVTNKAKLLRLLELVEGKYYVQKIDDKVIASYKTIYWDTDEHRFFTEHRDGCAPRYKVRVRTYLDSNITFLEVKKKDNHGRTKKKRIDVEGQEVIKQYQEWLIARGDDPVGNYKDATTPQERTELFLQERAHVHLRGLEPCLQNRFHRITLVNKAKTERLTIDFDVCFDNFETGEHSETGDLVIVELKRDGNVFSPVKALLRELRIKPSGFSKYCIGTVLTNKRLKRNNFKPKITRLRKLTTGFGEETLQKLQENKS